MISCWGEERRNEPLFEILFLKRTQNSTYRKRYLFGTKCFAGWIQGVIYYPGFFLCLCYLQVFTISFLKVVSVHKLA